LLWHAQSYRKTIQTLKHPDWMTIKKDEHQHRIDITLDGDRYQEILEICNIYKAKQGMEITPKRIHIDAYRICYWE
jgi:hypothetical protein